jgi:hypothetical protein
VALEGEYSDEATVANNVDIIICLIAIKTITATKNIKYMYKL